MKGSKARSSRRQFIKQTGAAAVGGMLAADALGRTAGRAATGFDYDVIVIGAGFAGATAARELGEDGLRVGLFEARNRLGGLTYTSRFAGHDIELGGMWFHWLQPNIWAEIHRYGMHLYESPVLDPQTVVLLGSDGKRQVGDASLVADVLKWMDALHHDSFALYPQAMIDPYHVEEKIAAIDHQSIQTRLDSLPLTTRERDVFSGLLEIVPGSSLSEASLTQQLKLHALAGWNSGLLLDLQNRFRLKEGTNGLISAIVEDSGADVHLSTPIAAIDHGPGHVEISTEDDKKITARCAILTLPINTFNNVKFTPGLPSDKQTIIDKGQPSTGTKVYVQVAQDLGRFQAFGPAASPLTYMHAEYFGSQGSVLIGFGGQRELLDINDNAAIEQAVKAYIPDVEFQSAVAYDWTYDPYSLGTWPNYRKGEMYNPLIMRRPEGALFFAGGYTAKGWTSFVDGAVESGIRVAREVQELFG